MALAAGSFEPHPFFVIGGTMPPSAPSYVRRAADEQLEDALARGEFCYVLDTRQMGKSSIVAQAASRAHAKGMVSVATVDLQRCGQSLTIEQWYEAQVSQIAEDLDLEDEVEQFWESIEGAGPLDRWTRTIRFILDQVKGSVIVFIDEIDFVRSLGFPTDEFFGGIRGFYNERALDPSLKRLTFCLVGVAVPNDLIRNQALTPFNIGTRIDLSDFTESEVVQGFAPGFARPSKPLLKRIWYWTEGHPYLTQKLAQAVAADSTARTARDVDRICTELFLTTGAREQNDNLRFVASRLLDSTTEPETVLDLYRKVLAGEQVHDERATTYFDTLRLSGIVRSVDGSLQVRNPVYRKVFDEDWIAQNMPGRETRRQEEAYRRGRRLATRIAGPILVLLAIGWAAYATIQNRRLTSLTNQLSRQTVALQNRTTQLTQVTEDLRLQAIEADKLRKVADTKRTEAEINQQRALDAEQESRQTAERAIEASNAATAARGEAERNRVAAETSAESAREAELREKEERKKAEAAAADLKRQVAISTPMRLAARSEADRLLPDLTAPSILLGIEALGRRWSVDTYAPVLQSLTLLPRDATPARWEHPLSEQMMPVASAIWRAMAPDKRQCYVQLVPRRQVCAPMAGELRPWSANYALARLGTSEIRYWDVWKGKEFLKPDPRISSDSVLSTTGERVAALDGRDIVVREFPSGNEVARLRHNPPKVDARRGLSAVLFSPRDRYLITQQIVGEERRQYLVWDLEARKKLAFIDSEDRDLSFQFSPEPTTKPGSSFLRISTIGQLCKVPDQPATDQDKPSVLSCFPILGGPASLAVFSEEARRLIVSTGEVAYQYDLSRLPPPAQPFPGVAGTSSVSFSRDGTVAAFVVLDKYARVFNVAAMREVARVLHTGIRAAAFEENSVLVTASLTGTVRSIVDGRRHAIDLPRRSSAAALLQFSPTGTVLATGRGAAMPADLRTTVLDVSGAPTRILQTVAAAPNTVLRFSSNSKTLFESSSAYSGGAWQAMSFVVPSGHQQKAFLFLDAPIEDVSPDGRFVITRNGELWDAHNGTRVESQRVGSVVAFPDEASIAFATGAQLYRMQLAGSAVTRVPSPLTTVTHTIASPDQRYLLLQGTIARGAAPGKQTWVWWDTRQSVVTVLPWSTDGSPDFGAISPQGTYVAFRFRNRGEIRHLATGDSLFKPSELVTEFSTSLPTVLFSPDEKSAIVDLGSRGVVLDLATRANRCTIDEFGDRSPIGFDWSSARLAIHRTGTGTGSRRIEFWNASKCALTDDKPVSIAQASRPPQMSADGRLIAWSEGGVAAPLRQNDSVQIASIDKSSGSVPAVAFTDSVTAITFSDDGRVLLAGARDGAVQAIDLTRAAEADQRGITVPPHLFDVRALALSPGGGRYSASGSGLTLRLWETRRGTVAETRLYDDRVMALAFDRTGEFLAVGIRSGEVHILRVPTLHPVKSLKLDAQLVGVSFSGDGRYLGANGPSRVRLWDTSTWNAVEGLPEPTKLTGTLFGRSGHVHASYSPDTVWIWSDDRPTATIKPDGIGQISAVALSIDNRYLFIGGSSGVRVWDLDPTQKPPEGEVARIGQGLAVRSLALSPDDRYLAVTYSDGTGDLTLWKPTDLMAEVCRRLGDQRSVDITRYFLPGEHPEHGCAPEPQTKETAEGRRD